ncbi:hypothetical protein [Paraliobacillus ryukyuensis]|uniref:hypothetical protein n=1 Tax=Paraliobacillus ryukyuensis TaxID=200904 RepID=UPI0009A75616|nr:hypothetical protein [Paraliobacillus ryukyuensis]
METNNVEKVDFSRIQQNMMMILREHAESGSDLEKELSKVIDMINEEQNKSAKIKELVYELAAKL